MSLLIPYVHLPQHPDPLFNEFTYGDGGARGRKLASLSRGEHLFFHTSLQGRKVVSAYFVVDRVLSTSDAFKDQHIRLKYRNPHLEFYCQKKRPLHDNGDYIAFGDPITSRVLNRPLPLDKSLARKLSLNIMFPRGKTEAQAIGQATRAWRELSPKDVRTLLRECSRADASSPILSLPRSTEEVSEVVEKDIEEHLAARPAILGKGLELEARQLQIATGRIDLLFRDAKGHLLLVEVKLGRIGREAISQTEAYLAELRTLYSTPVRAAIVCAGVLPAFEKDIRKKRSIRILTYGWKLNVEDQALGPAEHL